MYSVHLDKKHITYISDPEGIGPTLSSLNTVKLIILDWYKNKYNKDLNITEKLKVKEPLSSFQQIAHAAGFGSEKSADDFNYFLEFETLEEAISFYKNFSFIDLDMYHSIFDMEDRDYSEIVDWLKENVEKYSLNDFLGTSCVFFIQEKDALGYKLRF